RSLGRLKATRGGHDERRSGKTDLHRARPPRAGPEALARLLPRPARLRSRLLLRGVYAGVSRDGGPLHLQCATPAPRDQAAFERAELIDACVVVHNVEALA